MFSFFLFNSNPIDVAFCQAAERSRMETAWTYAVKKRDELNAANVQLQEQVFALTRENEELRSQATLVRDDLERDKIATEKGNLMVLNLREELVCLQSQIHHMEAFHVRGCAHVSECCSLLLDC